MPLRPVTIGGMKTRLLVVCFLCCVALVARGQNLDDQYVRIYNLIQQGEGFEESKQADHALEKFQEAEALLKKIQASYPNWNEKVVAFRLRYVSEKITALQPLAAAMPKKTAPATPPGPGDANVAVPAQPVDQITLLKSDLQRLQAEKVSLEAKLREALSAQPAAVDPRELAKADERIKLLAKENEILKLSLAQEKAKASQAVDLAMVDKIKKALDDSDRKLKEQTEKLKEQSEIVAQLGLEKNALQARLDSMSTSPQDAALRSENEALRKQLHEIRDAAKIVAEADAQSLRKLAEAKAELAARQSRIDELTKANSDLRLKPGAPAPKVDPTAEADKRALNAKIATLEKELSDAKKMIVEASASMEKLQKEKAVLISQLAAPALATAMATAEPQPARKTTKPADYVAAGKIADQLASLRARLEVLEARAVPYTAEELALFKAPTPATGAPVSSAERKPTKSLPGGAATLVAKAERAFSEQKYGEAEGFYREVLKLDDRNVYSLASLAEVQAEQGHLDEADATLKQALALDPNDALSLSMLGVVRFKQGKFDEALEALGKSAQLDPSNADTQNYLGITLSQKGTRAAAEAALRRAIQLSPNHANAHHNLAVVYATSQPPSVELARWHYQKALDNGHPKNSKLEQQLDGKAGAAK